MKVIILFLALLSSSAEAEESRKIHLRQVDVRQRLALSVNPAIGGRIRLRLSMEQGYKAGKKAAPIIK